MPIGWHCSNTVVIGAGPAGIGVGLALGSDATVVEQAPEPGGLCRSHERHGTVFDYGGHSFHTPHPAVRELVCSAIEMYEQKREAWCATHDTMVPYPFQAHFSRIRQPAVIDECQAGLDMADEGRGAASFEEYVKRRFGPGIAKHFLLPYNRKLWGPDLSRMAADWAGERVAASAKAAERFAETGGRRLPLQADTTVAYPARGGFGEIMRALASRLTDLRLGKTAVRLDPDDRELILHDGGALRWDRLVSTIPLDQLLALLPAVPDELMAGARRLEALPLALVVVYVEHPVDTPIQRIYSADPECPPHKIALNHNSSSFLRTLPRHAVVAEVSSAPKKPRPAEGLERAVVRHLTRLGIIASPADVLATEVLPVPYAYPVPTHDRDAIVARIKAWLRERGIHTVGRFGEWAYINADEALHRGLTLGRTLG